jgi:hypothetical protein
VLSLAAVAAQGLVDRWRDLGPTLWLVAGVGAAAWALLLAAMAFATRCRHVDPGPAGLDLGGPEPAAVVNLLTSGWRLGHEAVPATLLDLAARRVVGIDQVGEQTLIRTLTRSAATPDLEPYERMVLDHVVHQAVDGVVPAEALTTGPDDESTRWWRRFRRSVERDARSRGLSKRRWSPAARVVLTLAAVAVGCLVAVAATTLPADPKNSDDNPVGAALGFGAMATFALVAGNEAVNGERDTPAGRDAAGRWLGLRTLLADDPLFAEYPPAGVAIWDRLLAFGAAMGVAHGAVRALPLGSESDKQAWSSVGGRWRVVRIRYPRYLPPGYGRHPAVVVLVGLAQVALAGVAFPAARAATDALVRAAARSSTDAATPASLRLGVDTTLAVVVAAAAILVVRGVLMVVTGAVDLCSGRRRFEGRVLRVRRRGDDDHPRWYVAVDDGTSDHVRAWRTSPLGATQASMVRADVTRWLAHVRALEVSAPAPARPSFTDGDDDEVDASPLSHLLGTTASARRGALGVAAGPPGPPPPLPDARAVAEAAGCPLVLDEGASSHPLAQEGGSATFTAPGGTAVQVAWVDPALLQAHRAIPRLLRRELKGVGDEAYRAVMGGGVVVRQGGRVLMVMGRLPDMSDDGRDRALEAVARVTLASSTGTGTGTGR